MPAWEKVICERCGQEVSRSNLSKHLRRHELHPESFDVPKYKVDHEGLNCLFCGKECKNNNSLRNHERLCKLNPDRQIVNHRVGFNNIGRVAWNKGLTKDTDSRVKLQSTKMLGKYKGRKTSEDTKLKISSSIKSLYGDGKLGTRLHRVKHDRNKYGTYAGYHCDSSWELAYVLFNIDHGIKFERNSEYFTYEFEGISHKYFPDFIEHDSYVEIKGRVTPQDEAKFKYFPDNKKLVIIGPDNIGPYIDYCTSNYGDYTKLYDRSYPCYLDKFAGVV